MFYFQIDDKVVSKRTHQAGKEFTVVLWVTECAVLTKALNADNLQHSFCCAKKA